MASQPLIDDATIGGRLLRIVETVFTYTPPQRVHTGTVATGSTVPYHPPPSPNRLPSFIIHVDDLDKRLIFSLTRAVNRDLATQTIGYKTVYARCSLERAADATETDFRDTEIGTQSDTHGIAVQIIARVKRFVKLDFKGSGSGYVVWENQAWEVFDDCAEEIIKLAGSDEGKELKWETEEENGRAMLCKLATAMFDRNLHWGLLFGGDGAILLQRCTSKEEPTRHGLLCSGFLKIDKMFLLTLGMLLVPGGVAPSIDVLTGEIPVPIPKSPPAAPKVNQDEMQAWARNTKMIRGAANLDICMSLPGFEYTVIRVAPSSPPPLPPSHDSTPTLLVYEFMHFTGAIGTIYAADFGSSLALVVKAVAPRENGEKKLRHEAHVYNVLAELQGRVIPRVVGLFEGEDWTMLIAEDCGDKVGSFSELSLAQRKMLWGHACEIHAKGVRHGALDLQNFLVSRSGEVRIVDFASAEVGHECEDGVCKELSNFRKRLQLD